MQNSVPLNDGWLYHIISFLVSSLLLILRHFQLFQKNSFQKVYVFFLSFLFIYSFFFYFEFFFFLFWTFFFNYSRLTYRDREREMMKLSSITEGGGRRKKLRFFFLIIKQEVGCNWKGFFFHTVRRWAMKMNMFRKVLAKIKGKRQARG